MESHGRDQRRILAQAVAGHIVRAQSFRFKHAPHSGRDGYQRGLRVLSEFQLVCRTFKAKPREGKLQSVVGFLESLAGKGELSGEGFPHSRELGSLSRKKECGDWHEFKTS